MSEKDVLISRIVDREDTPMDWSRLDSLAERDCDHDVFGALVEAMRDESTLRTAVAKRVAVADRIELGHGRVGFLARNQWVAQWSGWMAAAVIALIWMATDPRMKRAPRGGEGARTPGDTRVVEQDHRAGANANAPDTSDAVPDVRLASDETVRELPNVMVESRSIPGTDKIELFYIRQTLERTVVSGAYTLGRDEVGQPFKAKLARFPRTETRKY